MTTHSYFDLYEFNDALPQTELAGAMASATLWKIDTMIINSARQLYKTVRDDLVASAGVDQRAEITNALNEQAYAEQSFNEIGSHVTGPVTTIKELYYVREAWEALAERLVPLAIRYTSSDGQEVYSEFRHRTIDDQIFNPGESKVAPKDERRIRESNVFLAKALGSPESAEMLFQHDMQSALDDKLSMRKNMLTQAQGVSYMLELALKHDMPVPESPPTSAFYSLTLDTQRALINNAISGLDRERVRIAKSKVIKDIDFSIMLISWDKATKALQAVLKSPRFANNAQQTAASEVNTG